MKSTGITRQDQVDTSKKYNVDLVANAYAKNYANIRSGIILNALSKVNNIEDAFILFSAFLSLSTDNAKDPTLPKINATP